MSLSLSIYIYMYICMYLAMGRCGGAAGRERSGTVATRDTVFAAEHRRWIMFLRTITNYLKMNYSKHHH